MDVKKFKATTIITVKKTHISVPMVEVILPADEGGVIRPAVVPNIVHEHGHVEGRDGVPVGVSTRQPRAADVPERSHGVQRQGLAPLEGEGPRRQRIIRLPAIRRVFEGLGELVRQQGDAIPLLRPRGAPLAVGIGGRGRGRGHGEERRPRTEGAPVHPPQYVLHRRDVHPDARGPPRLRVVATASRPPLTAGAGADAKRRLAQ